MVLAYLSVPAFLAGVGAYLDWRYRRLPNALCFAAFASGIGFAFLLHGASSAGFAALHGVLALLVGMVLFSRGWIGGGDAKFYAGLATWIPLSTGWLLILCVSVAGLLLLLVWFPLRRTLAPTAGAGPGQADHLKLPYGVAIAIGAFAALLILYAP